MCSTSHLLHFRKNVFPVFDFNFLVSYYDTNRYKKMPSLDLSNLPEREEDINFDDIYEKHAVDNESDFDTIVVVDGAPIVDDKKQEKLLAVLSKLFTKNAGDIKENGIWMPMIPDKEGKSTSKG
jgi:translation initiation factor 3 subunit B